jgi:hypothetical protein
VAERAGQITHTQCQSDVLAFMREPHRMQTHATNPLERVNAETKRRRLTGQTFGVTNLVAARNHFGYNYP